jgi:hypothetical protein
MAKWLWITGSGIFLLLGIVHLYYTFFTNKFAPFNKSTLVEMKYSTLLLTKKTTVWKAWTGFNASHSLGAAFFGLINIILAAQYFFILQHSPGLLVINILMPLAYLALAKKYWFNIPFTGILIASVCLIMAVVVIIGEKKL